MVIDFQYFFLCHYYLNNFIQKTGKANKFAKRRQRLDYPEDFISRFYIQAHFSRRTKKDQKTTFFRCNNISSHGFCSFFIIKFCVGFTRTEKKYIKVIDDDICHRKIKLKKKIIIIKRNRNYKKVDRKTWRVLKCKQVVPPRDFRYKV